MMPAPNGAVGYWYDQLVDRHLKRGMVHASAQADEALKNGAKPHDILVSLMNELYNLNAHMMAPKLFDFRNAEEIIAASWISKKQQGVKLGWKTPDELMGFQALPGDLISMVGRPGQGDLSVAT